MLKKLARLLDQGLARLSWRSLGTARAITSAGLITLITFGALHTLKPPPPRTAPVLVAQEDLIPGTKLNSTVVQTVHYPVDLIPPAALSSTDEVEGKTLATAARQGTFITDSSLIGPRLYSDVPPGTVAAPVRFADSDLVALLQPGDKINVLSSATTPAWDGADSSQERGEVAARAALVLAAPLSERDEGGFLGSPGSQQGSIVLLAVTESEATELAAASQMGGLSITLVE